MVRRTLLTFGCLLLGCLLLGAGGAAAAAPRANEASLRYLRLAERGIAQASHWRDRGWYDEYAPRQGPTPLATVWASVGLMQAVDAVQLLVPSPAHRRAVDRLARRAESFWNGARGGYAPYPGWNSSAAELWFDDNGWLGLSFMSAYRATRERRYLADARRAFDYIMANGWDRNGGGLWWNVRHDQKSGEAMGAAALLGALLAEEYHRADYRRDVQTIADWANDHDFKSGVGLYGSLSARGNAAVDYVQAPLIYAQYLVCQGTGQHRYCDRARRVADDAVRSYGDRFNFAPQYDAIYLQWMMAFGQSVGDSRFLALAQRNADAAAQHAGRGGVLLGSWWGGPIGDSQVHPGMLRTHGATTSLFAWTAYYTAQAPPPSRPATPPAPAPAPAPSATGGGDPTPSPTPSPTPPPDNPPALQFPDVPPLQVPSAGAPPAGDPTADPTG